MNQHAPPRTSDDPITAVAIAPARPMSDWAKRMHGLTILLMGLGVIAATAVGFAQSWAGLYGWGVEHGLTEWKAISFPAMVDTFIGIGELGLFALALEGHRLRQSLGVADLLLPLSLAAGGWAASLAFNVGHVAQVWTTQITAGVPPVASMLGLFVMLRTLHRLVSRPSPGDQPVSDGFGHPAGVDGDATDQPPVGTADPARPAPEESAGREPVLDLPEALAAAKRAGGSGRQIADALGLRSRDRLYALINQGEGDGGQDGDDGSDPDEGGRDDHPDAEYYAGELGLDPAKVQAILGHRTDLALAGRINGHPIGGDHA